MVGSCDFCHKTHLTADYVCPQFVMAINLLAGRKDMPSCNCYGGDGKEDRWCTSLCVCICHGMKEYASQTQATFFIVRDPETSPVNFRLHPTKKFHSLTFATEIAQKLAKENPGARFYVVKAVNVSETSHVSTRSLE